MMIDKSTFSVLNTSKKCVIELYIVSCYDVEHMKLIEYYCYTTLEEAQNTYEGLQMFYSNKDYHFYLNKYLLRKVGLKYSLNTYLNEANHNYIKKVSKLKKIA